MQFTIILLVASLSIVCALPSVLVEDDQGQQYHLTPVVLSRQRRDGAKIFGQGFANKGVQGGYVGIANPNGSGGSIGHGHANGYGHDLSVNGMVPVWSNKNGFGQSTINVGGGIDKHFGGYGGSHTTGKRVGINFNHQF